MTEFDKDQLRAARKWATNTLNRGVLTPPLEYCDAAAELILSLPEPAPTMADIGWSDAEHHLAEAEWHTGEKLIMLGPSMVADGAEWITCQRADGKHTTVRMAEELTPTGNRHRLVLAEWKGSPVLDRQPGTTEPVEDAVVEPRVLRTVDDFTAATPGTAVLIDDTVLTKRLLDGRWSDAYCYVREDHRLAEVGPATVIHTPGGGA